MSFLKNSLDFIKPQKGIDTLLDWRKEVFAKVIRSIGIAGTIVYAVSVALYYQSIKKETLLLYTFSYLLIMIAAFVPRLSTIYRTYVFTSVIFFIGVLTSAEKASIGDGRIWLILAVFLASVFLGRRAGLIYAVAATVAWFVIGYLFNTSLIPYVEIEQFSFSIWMGTTVTVFIVSTTMVLAINALSDHLSQNVNKKASLAKIAEEQSLKLEEQRDALERRSKALEASAKISRSLASITRHEDILDETPKLLYEGFNLNNATLFLFDAEKALRQVSSHERIDQAQNMHESLSSEEKDLLNRAIIDERAYSNVNPNLEESSQTYLAIPMQGQEKTIGVFFLRSNDVEAFDAGKISVLQMLANHIAVLLENANLLAQKESALDAERRAYGEIAQGAWKKFIGRQEYGSYRRDEKGLRSVPTKLYLPQETEVETEAVPIRVQGKIIGHIDARKAKNRAWTASEKELLGILASRLETAIDSARLYQEAQERADRERVIGEVSAKMRETHNIETVLETATKELHKALGGIETKIWLSTEAKETKDD